MSSEVVLKLTKLHSPTEHLCNIVVDLLVEQIPSIVFQGIFDGDNSENHHQRNHGNFLLKGFNNWHPVQQCQEQKVEVGSPEKQTRPEQQISMKKCMSNINVQQLLKCNQVLTKPFSGVISD